MERGLDTKSDGLARQIRAETRSVACGVAFDALPPFVRCVVGLADGSAHRRAHKAAEPERLHHAIIELSPKRERSGRHGRTDLVR